MISWRYTTNWKIIYKIRFSADLGNLYFAFSYFNPNWEFKELKQIVRVWRYCIQFFFSFWNYSSQIVIVDYANADDWNCWD